MLNTSVRGIHARFAFDQGSGIFTVKALHRSASVIRALSAINPLIQIGDLVYEFTYTKQAGINTEAAFQALEAEFFNQYLSSSAAH